MKSINKNMYIEEIVEQYPQLIRPLKEAGIVCIRCGEPVWGTLVQVASEKKIPHLDRIIAQMNQLLSGD